MKKSLRPLNERMKKGELYVVFSGLEDFSLRFIGYGDGTPRIYSKEALDDRVWDQLRICKSVETANRCLGPETYAVVLPLSALITFCGDHEVRRWAGPQRSVNPKDVREYVSKWIASRSTASSRDSADDRKRCMEWVKMQHGCWIAANSNGTLEELREHLESVRSEMLRYDGQELIADYIDELDVAADYLGTFEDDDDRPTFDYRLENVDEDLEQVDDLIELVGESFKVADLPSREDAMKPSSLALAG